MELLNEEARETFIDEHPEWEIEDETLRRTFDHESFAEAVGFVAAVGVLAEKAFHHPDIDIRYTKVSIALTTHDAGGLTSNDTELGRQIEALR